MTFGYDATAAFGKSMAGIEDHARALLGGLVEKRRSGAVSSHLICILRRGRGVGFKNIASITRLVSLIVRLLDWEVGA